MTIKAFGNVDKDCPQFMTLGLGDNSEVMHGTRSMP
jgi:hypothetical protein